MKVIVTQIREVENCIEDECFYADYEDGKSICEHWKKKCRSLEEEEGIPEDCPFRKKKSKKKRKKK